MHTCIQLRIFACVWWTRVDVKLSMFPFQIYKCWKPNCDNFFTEHNVDTMGGIHLLFQLHLVRSKLENNINETYGSSGSVNNHNKTKSIRCLHTLWDITHITWWRHQIETFSASLAICAGNSPVTGEFPAQRQVTRSIDVFFDLRPNKLLS